MNNIRAQVVILFFLIMVMPVFSYPDKKELIELSRINAAKEKEMILRMVFKLSRPQPFLGGTNEKYVFDGATGEKYLFKVYPKLSRIGSHGKVQEAVCRFAEFCGLEISKCYYMEIPINGKSERGVMQRLISPAVPVYKIDLKKKDREYISKMHIFDWLLNNTDAEAEHFLFDRNDDKLVTIDHDSVFGNILVDEEYEEKVDVDFGYYSDFWEDCRKNRYIVDLTGAMCLMSYIEGMSYDDLNQIFYVPVREAVRSVFASILDSEAEKMTETVLKSIWNRKKTMRKRFASFYRPLMEDGTCISTLEPRPDAYASGIFLDLRRSITYYTKKLKETDKRLQGNITAVSSLDGWNRVLDFRLRSKHADTERELEYALYDIDMMCRSERGDAEMLALMLYRRYLTGLKRRQDMHALLRDFISNRVSMHPLDMDPDSLGSIFRVSYAPPSPGLDEMKDSALSDIDNIPINIEYIKRSYVSNRLKETSDIYENLYKSDISDDIKKFYSRLCKCLEIGWWDIGYTGFGRGFAWVYYMNGLQYHADGNTEEAIKSFGKIIEIGVDVSAMYYARMSLGIIYEHNREGKWFGEGTEWKKAIDEFLFAERLMPSLVSPKLHLMELYSRCGMLEEVKEKLREVLGVCEPYSDTHGKLKDILGKKDRDPDKTHRELLWYSMEPFERDMILLTVRVKRQYEEDLHGEKKIH